MPEKERAFQTITQNLQTEYYDVVGEKSRIELETESANLLNRLGVTEKIDNLDKERLTIVTGAIAALWNINTIGLKMENLDREIVGGLEVHMAPGEINMSQGVADKIKEIEDEFHNENADWFDESVVCVVNAALDPVDETQKVSKERAMDLPAKYIGRLDMASQVYKSIVPLSDSGTNQEVQNYLYSERPSNINWMKVGLSEDLEPKINGLVPLKSD